MQIGHILATILLIVAAAVVSSGLSHVAGYTYMAWKSRRAPLRWSWFTWRLPKRAEGKYAVGLLVLVVVIAGTITFRLHYLTNSAEARWIGIAVAIIIGTSQAPLTIASFRPVGVVSLFAGDHSDAAVDNLDSDPRSNGSNVVAYFTLALHVSCWPFVWVVATEGSATETDWQLAVLLFVSPLAGFIYLMISAYYVATADAAERGATFTLPQRRMLRDTASRYLRRHLWKPLVVAFVVILLLIVVAALSAILTGAALGRSVAWVANQTGMASDLGLSLLPANDPQWTLVAIGLLGTAMVALISTRPSRAVARTFRFGGLLRHITRESPHTSGELVTQIHAEVTVVTLHAANEVVHRLHRITPKLPSRAGDNLRVREERHSRKDWHPLQELHHVTSSMLTSSGSFKLRLQFRYPVDSNHAWFALIWHVLQIPDVVHIEEVATADAHTSSENAREARALSVEVTVPELAKAASSTAVLALFAAISGWLLGRKSTSTDCRA